MSTASAAAISYPQPRNCPYQPSADYQELGTEQPLHRVELWNGETVWLVTGHAVARRLLADPRISADREREDFPVVLPRFEAAVFKPLALIGIDAPRHTVHRKILAPHFGLKQARERRPEIERLAGSLLDDIEDHGPGVDLLPAYALPIPSVVVSQILGVPYTDHAFFEKASAALLQAPDAPAAAAAGDVLLDYLDRLVAAEETAPTGNGVLTELVAAVDGRDVTREDALRIALALLLGGHDTTAQMITMGVVTLLDHPDQLAQLHADPSLWPAAVDELLRMVAVTDVAGVRVARTDITDDDGSVLVREGEGLIFSSSMLNRDPAVWSDPYRLDLFRERDDPTASGRRHLTFGHGPHQCLGQNLARTELEIAFRSLFTRFPGLHLDAPVDDLPYRRNGTMQGVKQLIVHW